MSVQDGPLFKRYAANGVTTIFTIPFLVIDAGDLQVILNGTTITSGFGLGTLGGPTTSITFNVAPTGDLLLLLTIPFERLTDYQELGDFLASTVNRDMDRLWLAAKELRRDDGRALTVSPLEPEGISALPVAALRSGRVLAFTENGDPIPSTMTLAQIEDQPQLAVESAQAAAASALIASDRQLEAAASATAAQKWAENPEDVPVTPGLFSAHHWATKAFAALAGVLSRLTTIEAKGKVFHLQDQKAPGAAAGGTFTAGGWRPRDLTAVVVNEIAGASLNANQVTLPAGTYRVSGSAPATYVTFHQARLYSVTGAVELVAGTSEVSTSGSAYIVSNRSFIEGYFTLAVPTVIEIQHYCTVSYANGFGVGFAATGKTKEVYSDIKFTKVA